MRAEGDIVKVLQPFKMALSDRCMGLMIIRVLTPGSKRLAVAVSKVSPKHHVFDSTSSFLIYVFCKTRMSFVKQELGLATLGERKTAELVVLNDLVQLFEKVEI